MIKKFLSQIRLKLRPRGTRGRAGQRQRRKLDLKWWAQAVALGTIWGFVALSALLGWYAYDLPDIRAIEGHTRRPAIAILAADGSQLARYGDYFADRIAVAEMPQHLIQAVMSIEDRRFYQHGGIDVLGLLRAFYSNMRAGHVVQGGSTITQQLAKNLFLTPDRTFRRKVQEMMLAFWLESQYGKDQILGAYLNRVYLGAGTYGVDAAAKTYFGKSAHDVNLYEAAVLAGLLKAPSRYAPTSNPEAARARAAIVLSAMVDAGHITEQQKAAALAPAGKTATPARPADARYFTAWILEQAQELAGAAGQDLVIQTTLDARLQRAAEEQIDKILDAEGEKRDVDQAALLTLAPDGAVRAYVGGYDYSESEFDRVSGARRQPGSSFKPFVFLAAIEQGLKPGSPVTDSPVKIGNYAPENYDGKYYGVTTAREALAHSMNSVAIKLLRQSGIDAVRRDARALGIVSPLGRDLSLALGTSEVSLYELTSAYAAMAAGGRSIAPYAIVEIRTRGGERLYRRPDVQTPQLVDPGSVATLVDMMTDVIAYGTGAQARLDRPAAGKTGTTQDYHDAWFVGFTADYTTGVWLGNDDNSSMKRVTGGALPAKLWRDYMLIAHAGLPPRSLPALKGTGSPVTAIIQAPADVADRLGSFISRLLGSR